MIRAEPGQLPRLLLLDDDERILSLRGSMLRQRGCEVVEVSNLGDALNAFEKSSAFDLAIVDINLGGGSEDRRGIEFARFVREKYAHVPIVAYSATFSEHELTDEERGQFERIFARGTAGVEDLAEITDWMVKLARGRHRPDAE